MINRNKLIEEIIAGYHAIKNKMHARLWQSGNNKDCITHSQIFVLSIIAENNNIGIKEISEKLSISSSASTQLVDGLVENGYAVRKASAKDRRALHLEISAKGRKYLNQFKNKRLKVVSTLFDVLTDSELRAYLALNKKILSNILDKHN